MDTVSITTIQSNVTLMVSDYNGSNISCFNADDGFITATVSSLVDNFEFEWSNGADSLTISGLEPGMYTITKNDGEIIEINDGLKTKNWWEELVK